MSYVIVDLPVFSLWYRADEDAEWAKLGVLQNEQRVRDMADHLLLVLERGESMVLDRDGRVALHLRVEEGEPVEVL